MREILEMLDEKKILYLEQQVDLLYDMMMLFGECETATIRLFDKGEKLPASYYDLRAKMREAINALAADLVMPTSPSIGTPSIGRMTFLSCWRKCLSIAADLGVRTDGYNRYDGQA